MLAGLAARARADQRIAAELLGDEKERAEHVMLVDRDATTSDVVTRARELVGLARRHGYR